MEDLLEILRELHPDVDFEHCTDLVDGGILDSFDISIGANEIIPENFNSAEALYELISSKMDAEE